MAPPLQGRRVFSAGRRVRSTARRNRSFRLHSENPLSFDSVPNRLGRLDRIYVRAPIYFLTACTAQRRPLLAKQDVHLISGFKNGFVGRLTPSLPLTRPAGCPSMSLDSRRLHSVKRQFNEIGV